MGGLTRRLWNRLLPTDGSVPTLDRPGVPDTPLLRRCRDIRANPKTVDLPDGRTLGYAEQGDPDGRTVVLVHGHPNSRVFGALFDELGRDLGVHIVAPDRPGLGVSDPLPGRTFADWADDVAALLSALDCDSAPILGVSAGGPFALACGAHAPERVERLGLLCPVGPNSVLGLSDRLPFVLGVTLPATWRLDVYRRYRAAATDPASFLAASATERVEPDATLWESDFGHALLVGTLEGCRQGLDGYARDAKLLCSAWDFDPGEVSVPTMLRHGEPDEMVPVEMGRALAVAIPDVDAEFVEGLGHLGVIADHRREVVEWLIS